MLAAVSVVGCASGATGGASQAPMASQAEITGVLDAFHAAAARADGAAYFGLFAPGGVFIGTDVTERWSVAEFQAYAEPLFSKGRGWTYTPRSRTVVLGPDGRTAWFDEVLDSRSYGTSRGTGVLVRRPEGWRIAQYALSFPIPNDLAQDMTKRIRAFEAEQAPAARP
jgi:hypothetical protein